MRADIEVELVARERGVHALQTLLHGARGAAEREQPEVFMAEADEVIDHGDHARGAVERDGVGAFDAGVVDDEMRGAVGVEFSEALGDFFGDEMSDEHHGIDAHGEKMTDDAAALAGVEDFDERGVIAFAQEALEGGEFAHGGRRQQILHADADGGGAFAFEVQRVGVGREAGGFHRGLDALDGFSFEAGLAVEHAGNGRAREADVAGKIRRGTDLRERGGGGRFAHGGIEPKDFRPCAAVSMAGLKPTQLRMIFRPSEVKRYLLSRVGVRARGLHPAPADMRPKRK